MLTVIPIPAFNDNYIWLILNQENNQAAVVDPGDATPVLAYCTEHGITLCAILITHHHKDHTGGITQLLAHYNIPVFGPAGETIVACTNPLKEHDVATLPTLNQLSLRVLDIPGHTKGHIAYYGNGWLFCGDTLFSGGCGRLFEGTAEQMHHSLTKLKNLPRDTNVFPGHEYTLANLTFALTLEPHNPALLERLESVKTMRATHQPTLPSTIAIECNTNPFLRCHTQDIIAAAEDSLRQKPSSEAAVFAVIRAKKDIF